MKFYVMIHRTTVLVKCYKTLDGLYSFHRTLKKLRTLKGDYSIKQWFSNCVPFQNENFFYRKEFAPRAVSSLLPQ